MSKDSENHKRQQEEVLNIIRDCEKLNQHRTLTLLLISWHHKESAQENKALKNLIPNEIEMNSLEELITTEYESKKQWNKDNDIGIKWWSKMAKYIDK